MTRADISKKSPVKVLVIIVAIAVILVYISVAMLISDAAKGRSFDYDARDYLYSAENARYDNLYDTAIYDMERHAAYNDDVQECRALAFYYEQAVLERAYRESGDTAKADEFAERMKEYEAQLGTLSSRTKDVQDLLDRSVLSRR